MSERFQVRVTKDHLVFCSGHFISYEGDKCERLHGHNYRAAVEVEGRLDANHYVFDFIALKQRTKVITDALDHRMMLPTRNPYITLEERPRCCARRFASCGTSSRRTPKTRGSSYKRPTATRSDPPWPALRSPSDLASPHSGMRHRM